MDYEKQRTDKPKAQWMQKKRGSENIAVRDIAKENRGQETVEKKGVVLGKEKGGRV